MIFNKHHIYLGSISILCSCMLRSATVAMSSAAAMSSSAQTEQFSTTKSTGKSILERIQALNKSLADQANSLPQHTTVEIVQGNTQEKLTLFEQLTGIQKQLSEVTASHSGSDAMQEDLTAPFEQYKLVRSQLLKGPDSTTCQADITAIDKQFAALGYFLSTEPIINASSAALSQVQSAPTEQAAVATPVPTLAATTSLLDGNNEAAEIADGLGFGDSESQAQISSSAQSNSSTPPAAGDEAHVAPQKPSASDSAQSSSSSAILATEQADLALSEEDQTFVQTLINPSQREEIIKVSIKRTAIDLIKRGHNRTTILENIEQAIRANSLVTDATPISTLALELYKSALVQICPGRKKAAELVIEWVRAPRFDMAQFVHPEIQGASRGITISAASARDFCKKQQKVLKQLHDDLAAQNAQRAVDQQYPADSLCDLIALAFFHGQDYDDDPALANANLADLRKYVKRTCAPHLDALGTSAGDGRSRTNSASRSSIGEKIRAASAQQRTEARKIVRAYDPNLLPADDFTHVKRLSRWERLRRIRNFFSHPLAILGGIGLAGLIVYLIVRAKYPSENFTI